MRKLFLPGLLLVVGLAAAFTPAPSHSAQYIAGKSILGLRVGMTAQQIDEVLKRLPGISEIERKYRNPSPSLEAESLGQFTSISLTTGFSASDFRRTPKEIEPPKWRSFIRTRASRRV